MLVKYILCGPIAAAVCCTALLMADVGILPALLISWLFGSLAVGALAVYSIYCDRLTAENNKSDQSETGRSSGDNIPTSG